MGIFVLENIISGEVEIRHVNARLMWIAGVIYGVHHHVIVSAYAPTNDENDNGDTVKFYDTLAVEIKRIRDTYGEQIGIVIMGDFNARVGNDGGDLFTYEWTIPGNNTVKGRYGWEIRFFCN